jgi:hypothetical protein
MSSFKYEHKIEYIKNVNDYMKLLATLSSALLLLTPTMLVSVFSGSTYQWVSILATIGFAYSILAATSSIFFATDSMQYQDNDKYWAQGLQQGKSFAFCFFSGQFIFTLSVFALGLFIVINVWP